jgi:hypothetical protein
MPKVITLSFAVIGLVVGFVACLLAADSLNLEHENETLALGLAFAGAIVSAALLRWAATLLLRRVDPKYVPIVGSVSSSLALASVVLLFTQIK